METRSVRVVRAPHMPVVQTIQVQILSPGHMAGPSSWLGHQPLKLETRVRVPHPLQNRDRYYFNIYPSMRCPSQKISGGVWTRELRSPAIFVVFQVCKCHGLYAQITRNRQ